MFRYRVIEYAEQRDRGIVVSTWVPSEATEEQDDGNVSWKFCFLSHDNDHDDDTALVAEVLLIVSFPNLFFGIRALKFLPFSVQCRHAFALDTISERKCGHHTSFARASIPTCPGCL